MGAAYSDLSGQLAPWSCCSGFMLAAGATGGAAPLEPGLARAKTIITTNCRPTIGMFTVGLSDSNFSESRWAARRQLRFKLCLEEPVS